MGNPSDDPNEPTADWWYQAFPVVPYEKSPPGNHQMLILIAYDIANPKRLARVAEACEDYGTRVQYSVFECHLTTDELNDLWLRLLGEIHDEEDRVVAYRLDARSAQETLTAGRMVCSEKSVCYLI